MPVSIFSFADLLTRHRERMILEWRDRLKTQVSKHYAKRPADELLMTTGRAFDGFYDLLCNDDYTGIDAFISEITDVRLGAGFPLDDVQKAFELFRQMLIPILIKECPPDLLTRSIESVNRCLAYTIHKFSNHFQKMHERYLKEYASQLEKDVAARTIELKESEHKYKMLVENISDGYLVLHNENVILVNSAFCSMHGLKKTNVFMASFLDFVAKDSREKVRKIISRKVVNGFQPGPFEYQRLTLEGESLPTEMSFTPSRFKKRDYNLCILRDITKRVEMEKKSREMERMAYIGKITASLSHELRNPLSSVKMNLQILGRNPEFKGNDHRRLKISEKEIHRLEGILQQLLDYSKPIAVHFAMMDINPVVEFCAELLNGKFLKRHIACSVVTDHSLPRLMADKRRIEQVVINLLLNAMESIEGKGEVTISTGRHTTGPEPFVVIRVQDDGKGIENKELPLVFDPYYTTKTTGTGLGLANVKQIVDAHNGYINLISTKEPGRSGTTFEVFIPRGGAHG
ncbi:MAG: PAS domain S-box protein [Desulfobacteraceae bacterium]|nr:MAG: PAS domain S-box protein [Desulfobacteraceae bacterium]